LAAIPPVLGSALLILHGGEGPVGSVLSWRPVVGVGKGSYSLYLWHWPLFVILGSTWSVTRGAAGLACSVIATVISYRWIETPIRRSKRFGSRSAVALAVIGTLSIAIPCWLVTSVNSRNGEMPETWRGVATWELAETARESTRSSCTLADLAAPGSKFLIRIGAQQAPPTFALWGDSFALAMLPGVDAVASGNGRAGYFINLKHSLTLDADIGAYPFDPARDREPVLLWLESRRDIADVLLVNNWFSHLRDQADVDDAAAICQRLAGAGKHVFFFNDPPIGSEEALRKLSWGMQVDPGAGTMDPWSYDSRAYWQTRLADILTYRHLATIVPDNKAFLEDGKYYTTTGTRSYFLNFDHVNEDGAIKAMKFAGPLIWGQPGTGSSGR
jgi:hypothetical protein